MNRFHRLVQTHGLKELEHHLTNKMSYSNYLVEAVMLRDNGKERLGVIAASGSATLTGPCQGEATHHV